MRRGQKRTVRLLSATVDRLSVREWGLPTGLFVGKLWRSERHRTVTIILPGPDPERVTFSTRRVERVDRPEDQWLPRAWIDAARVYRREWPASAVRLRGVPS